MDESTTVSMRETDPEAALRAIIATHGSFVCDGPTALQSLLSEACPNQTEKVGLLLRACEARIPADLIWSNVAPRADLGNRLVARLQTRHSLSETDALWAVTSWMDALEVKTPRPRIRPAAQEPARFAETKDAPTSDSATSPAPQPTGLKGNAPQQTAVQKKDGKKPPERLAEVPGWAVGAIAAVFILGIGVALYISTGPPTNGTRAPAVVYNLPPGYKRPVRMVNGRPMAARPVKPSP